MKVIIAGSRTFNDYEFLKSECTRIIVEAQWKYGISNSEIEIVSGGAKGADLLGEQFAKEFGLPVKRFPANWKDMTPPCIPAHNQFGTYNKLVGMNRNQKMAEYVHENGGFLIAFNCWTNGILDMMKRARLLGIKVYEESL